jgi:hypothetical protein
MTVRWTWILLLAGLSQAAAAGDMPQDQKQFIEIVEHFHGAYTQGDSDIAKDATRLQRAKAICAAVRTPLVPLHSDYDSLVWASRRVAGCG